MINNSTLLQLYNSPVRSIDMTVELVDGSTTIQRFLPTDRLKNFTIERIGETKFFGFGVCQKLKVSIIDTEKELTITTNHKIRVNNAYTDSGSNYFITPFPLFDVYEVERDENTGELTITAYDALYKTKDFTFADLGLGASYSPFDIGNYAAVVLGLRGLKRANTGDNFLEEYPEGANFDGTENLRDVLNAVAEATQCIYFINYQNFLTFVRLDRDSTAVYTIDREKYFTLASGESHKLTAITCANDLGNNVTAALEGEEDTNQFVNNNPFWEMRDDIDTVLNTVIQEVGGLTINQFKCDWRGYALLEIGDKIDLVGKDDEIITSYLLNDTISYNGAYSQKSEWSFSQSKKDSFSNSTNLGEQLKNTYARVDKVEQKIEIVAQDTDAVKGSISSLQITTDEISAKVQGYQSVVDMTNNEVETLKKEVNAKMSAEDVSILITNETSKGSTKVVTETGFRFDDEGLTVSKSGSEMTTTITEDGMTVYRDNTAVLKANNSGVDATNLRATTYLIIGKNSRFEDYGSGRTGCFWIGG